MKKAFLIVTLAFAAFGAWAQQAGTAGSVANVSGNVSIVQNGVFTTVSNGTTFADGARIVAGANSSVTIKLPNNCDVNLAPGQALIVDSRATCQTMQASVTNVSSFAAASAATTSQTSGAGALGLNAGQLATFAFIGLVAYQSISPR